MKKKLFLSIVIGVFFMSIATGAVACSGGENSCSNSAITDSEQQQQ